VPANGALTFICAPVGIAASWRRMLADRLTAQLLAGPPAGDPLAVAERLLAIQGQDPRGARLAVRARTSGLHASDIDRALSEDRTLLITWLNRGTLHLVRSEDYPLLHALTTPQLGAANARRLAQEGVSPAAAERGVRVVTSALASEGPLAGDELRGRLDSAGIRTAGQALIHILFLTGLRGLTVRGPVMKGKHRYVLVRDWLGEVPPAPPDRTRALAELARRDGLVDVARRGVGAREVAQLPTRLLGAFDPVLHGWRSRADLLGAGEPAIIVGGLFRPFALSRGRAVALWKLVRGQVELDQPFARLTRAERAALEADGRDVERFLTPDV
jgi:hypothetical protein